MKRLPTLLSPNCRNTVSSQTGTLIPLIRCTSHCSSRQPFCALNHSEPDNCVCSSAIEPPPPPPQLPSSSPSCCLQPFLMFRTCSILRKIVFKQVHYYLLITVIPSNFFDKHSCPASPCCRHPLCRSPDVKLSQRRSAPSHGVPHRRSRSGCRQEMTGSRQGKQAARAPLIHMR